MTSQKVTINLEVVDVGKIDLLVAHGFYANRTDLVKHAVRNLLTDHSELILRESTANPLEQELAGERTHVIRSMGVIRLSRRQLEELADQGKRLRLTTVGMLFFDPAISPELADQTIEQIKAYGALKINPDVSERLGDRIR